MLCLDLRQPDQRHDRDAISREYASWQHPCDVSAGHRVRSGSRAGLGFALNADDEKRLPETRFDSRLLR